MISTHTRLRLSQLLRLMIQLHHVLLSLKVTTLSSTSILCLHPTSSDVTVQSHIRYTSTALLSHYSENNEFRKQKPLHAYLQNGRTLQLHDLSVLDPSLVSERILPQLSEPGTAIYNPYYRSLLACCADQSILKIEKVRRILCIRSSLERNSNISLHSTFSGETTGPFTFERKRMVERCWSRFESYVWSC